MTMFVVGIVVAILVSSALSIVIATQFAVGPQGPAGVEGPKGDTGDIGPQGLAGDTGPAGLQGAAGSQGATGATGTQGLTGKQGLQGEQGVGFEPIGNISISPSAFLSRDNDHAYNLDEISIENNDPFRTGEFYAPLQIPNGVEVTKVIFHWYDNDLEKNITFKMYETTRTAGSTSLVDLLSGIGVGYTSSPVMSAIIDNDKCIYTLYIKLPADDGVNYFMFLGAFIEYAYPS